MKSTTMKLKVNSGSEKQFMSIAEAQALKTDDLWVINTSESINDSGKGDVIFTVPVGDQLVSLMVQKTWLPRNLANQAPRESVIRSVHFLRAVQVGAIKIITNEYALKLLASDGAAEEEEELRAKEALIRTATRAKGVVTEEVVNLDQDANSRSIDMADMNSGDLPTSFKLFATRLNEMTDEKKVVNELRSHGVLSAVKAKYLIANLTSHPRIVKFLKGQLADE